MSTEAWAVLIVLFVGLAVGLGAMALLNWYVRRDERKRRERYISRMGSASRVDLNEEL